MTTENKSLLRQGMDIIDVMDRHELSLLIDYLSTVIKNRRQEASARQFMELKIGDKVKITGNIKPIYLRGLTGIIDDKRQTRIAVVLDRGPVKKFRSGKVICPPTALTKIED